MKSKIVFIIITIVLLLSLTGCVSKKDQNVAKILAKMLSTDNIGYTEITVGGDKITVYYEASSASKYDEQIVSDWATIFSAASNFDYNTVVIVNNVNGEPYVKLTTTRDNILSLINSEINEYVFFENVEIEAID